MKALFWILALFALAAGLIVAARYGTGYVLVVLPPYRIELALSFALLLLAAAFFIGYGLVRIAINVLELPAKVRAYHQRRRQEQAMAHLQEALGAFFAGRYDQAQRAAKAALELNTQPQLSTTQTKDLHRLTHIENLQRHGNDRDALAAYWQSLPEAERCDGYVAEIAARAFLTLDEHTPAREIVELSLQHEWDHNLVALYPDCAGGDAAPLIAWAERQLAQHPGDAVLQLALGRLCSQQKHWGQARTYLEASLASAATHSVHLALAQLFEQLGETAQANFHYQQALELTLNQLKNSSGGLRRAAL